MSQPFSWYKDSFAGDAWQNNYSSLEELQSNLDWLLNCQRKEIAKEIEAQIKDNEWAGAYKVAAAIARGQK